jgi:Asp-tRNA(Asn)/Glu-tRNA(Gln) amidotransferase A subunit family amidase
VEARQVHEEAGYFPARASEYGEDVRQRLEAGGHVRGVDYVAARKTIEQSRIEFEAALREVDAIVFPSTPVPAPLVGTEHVQIGEVRESVRDALLRLNRPANFTGLPAITVPCGFTSGGLQVGIQLIGRALDESTILHIAYAYERANGWAEAHPLTK